MAQRVIAVSRKSFTASGDLASRTQYVSSLLPAGDSMIIYDEAGDLVTQTAAILASRRDCLGTLEVWAHSNPLTCDQLINTNVDVWGQQLMGLTWCDNAFLYLDGCNTGCFMLGGGWLALQQTPTNIGPIAKALAEAMIYNSLSFPIHLTVFGTKGFTQGTHITGTETCKAYIITRHLFRRTEILGRYGEAEDGAGATVWAPFRNW